MYKLNEVVTLDVWLMGSVEWFSVGFANLCTGALRSIFVEFLAQRQLLMDAFGENVLPPYHHLVRIHRSIYVLQSIYH